ncbi:uncharacterized protein LOC121641422 [Melanotaenia boesemani]|uniref:uncharacterized protein LOC121641422 n=1 Tax=Melanotaenia boesemani TaxID=1250792 RepID=UPI001C048CF1|nr:uncharacterized protein LOC121641422 [Melanotaenia boesemani]
MWHWSLSESWRDAQSHCKGSSSDLVSIHNQNTEMSTMTAAQLLPTSSDSTPTATVNSQSFNQENLVLIQENMRWIEAMSYSREHHIDLIHITTKDIQDLVIEKVKNATSSHVWLGLRYTCSFQCWFWIESTFSCHQKWVPGHGPDEVYDCGVSGAIEATGRQQWAGLPEKEELNFICYASAG